MQEAGSILSVQKFNQGAAKMTASLASPSILTFTTRIIEAKHQSDDDDSSQQC